MSLAAEALVAVTGFLEPDPIRRKDGAAAARLPAEWRRDVREWLDQSGPRKFRMTPLLNHEAVIDELSGGLTPERLAELTAALEPEAAQDYAVVLSRVREVARAAWPALMTETPTGPRLVEASRTETGRASALLAVLSSPSRLLDEMRMETLGADQVTATEQAYPLLLQMLRTTVQEEVLRQLAKRKSWTMPWRQERVWRLLLNLPPTVSISSALPASSPGRVGQIDIDFREHASKTQKIDAL